MNCLHVELYIAQRKEHKELYFQFSKGKGTASRRALSLSIHSIYFSLLVFRRYMECEVCNVACLRHCQLCKVSAFAIFMNGNILEKYCRPPEIFSGFMEEEMFSSFCSHSFQNCGNKKPIDSLSRWFSYKEFIHSMQFRFDHPSSSSSTSCAVCCVRCNV